MSIVYIALIETITSPPGSKLFYCVEMAQFLHAVGSNGLPQHTQFPYELASFSRSGKHCCYVEFRQIHCLPKLLPIQDVVFYLFTGRAPYSSGRSLPLLFSASLSALALVHVFSVALLRPVSLILLSFPGDALPSVGLLALRSHLLLKVYRRPFRCRSPSSWEF